MASDITPEAIGFLSAVGVFIVALAVLFLFINKKLCFSRVGGLPCLEQHGRRKKGRVGIRQGLVNSYGDEDEDEDPTSSSDSEDEVLKQFEISVSRSQSFRMAAAPSVASSSGEQPSLHSQLSVGRRHKFTRLSDQEEGSTEPSDCEAGEMEAQSRTGFQDPLSAAVEESERASDSLSVDKATAAEAAASRDTPTPSMSRQAADGSEDTEKTADQDKNEATDSSSAFTPEVPQQKASTSPAPSNTPQRHSATCWSGVCTTRF